MLGLEYGGVTVAGPAVHAVRGDRRGRRRRSRTHPRTSCWKTWCTPSSPARSCSRLQQPLAADAAESVAAADESLAAEMDGDVVPVMEAGQDGGMRLRVGGAEVPHGLVGKHHAPAEGVVGAVTLIYLDTRGRQRLAQQNGGVEAGRPAAQADDSLHPGISPVRTRIVRVIAMLYCEVLQVSINFFARGLGMSAATPTATAIAGTPRRRHRRRGNSRRRSDRAAGARDADHPAAAAVRALQAVLSGRDFALRRARSGLVLEQHRRAASTPARTSMHRSTG